MNMFTKVSMRKPKRNKFNLSHDVKMSAQMGKLVPFLCQEIVPGDSWRGSAEVMVRLAPMIAPIMHRVNVYTHYFFVPNRLLWDKWEDFITGGESGTAIQPVKPYTTASVLYTGNKTTGSLADYLGLPVTSLPNTAMNSQQIELLPFKAYQLIYNEYYRDQNVQDEIDIRKSVSGLESGAAVVNQICQLRTRAWEKDYFTSALPWSQRGGEVTLPLQDLVPASVYDANDNPLTGDVTASAGGLQVGGTPATVWPIDPNAITINNLRRSIRLQEWLEKNARAGSRYIEQILSHFGVKSSDARLQRPQFLGGGKQPVVISEVLNTSGTLTEPQGNMAGHGISVGGSNGFKKSFEEHGFLFGIVSVMPKTAYQQGIPRMFQNRWDRFDYYWPEFAQIGEQEVFLSELYAVDNPNDDTVFGYQSRYADYKYIPDQVRGQFRTTLDHWHMGRIFESTPNLNASFIQSNPTKRIFAVEDANSEDLYIQIYNRIDALRPMPYFGTPTI